MKKLIVTLALLLCVQPVIAEPIAELNGKEGTLTLHSEPCTNKTVLDQIKPEYQSLFRAAELTWLGKTIAACWAEQPDFIFIIDEAGTSGGVPKYAFKKPGVGV